MNPHNYDAGGKETPLPPPIEDAKTGATEATCHTCRFFAPYIDSSLNAGGTGVCRRHVASPIVPWGEDASDYALSWAWPKIYPGAWCGEHEEMTAAQRDQRLRLNILELNGGTNGEAGRHG